MDRTLDAAMYQVTTAAANWQWQVACTCAVKSVKSYSYAGCARKRCSSKTDFSLSRVILCLLLCVCVCVCVRASVRACISNGLIPLSHLFGSSRGSLRVYRGMVIIRFNTRFYNRREPRLEPNKCETSIRSPDSAGPYAWRNRNVLLMAELSR